MTRVWLVEDEHFPVYNVETTGSPSAVSCDMDEAFLSRYRDAERQWKAVQAELKQRYNHA